MITIAFLILTVSFTNSALPPPRDPEPDAVTIDAGLLTSITKVKEGPKREEAGPKTQNQQNPAFNPNFNSIGTFPTGQGNFGVPTQIGPQPGYGGFPATGGPTGQFPQQPGQFPQQPGQFPNDLAPDVVAFTAVRASDFTRNAISQVRFDVTVTDIGYGWLPDRSEFVCYYPGLYFFTFSALSPIGRQFKLSLVKNNQDILSAWGDSAGYQTGSNTAILYLQQNDRVSLVLQEGSIHESTVFGRGYTSFSGFRIK
ncbi:complement C1q-like protein 3 isoform X2 [Artemia franciscana]|uniref:complement C1q-like protein 3 isoform X2 n=1 Tax=Artemia franciscana TaxID=6661 RepID=UPI0032DB91B9